MKTCSTASEPDFLVTWGNASQQFLENAYCEPPASTAAATSPITLRDAVASLQTPTTHVEVSEINLAEPITIKLIPHRPAFTLLVSSSATLSVDYGYETKTAKPAKIENVLFMLPDREISASCSAGTFRAVTCSFERDYAAAIVGSLDELSPSQLFNALDVRSALISSILLRLMREALHPGPISEKIVKSLGHAMLAECAHWILLDNAKPESTGKLAARHFDIIEQYLAGVQGKLPSVAELATACGFSERYFAKLFREQTGCSVMHYIKSVQIAKAKAYLLETDLPLKEIAFRLGFSTPANFSSAFMAATGSTPGQFRNTQ